MDNRSLTFLWKMNPNCGLNGEFYSSGLKEAASQAQMLEHLVSGGVAWVKLGDVALLEEVCHHG